MFATFDLVWYDPEYPRNARNKLLLQFVQIVHTMCAISLVQTMSRTIKLPGPVRIYLFTATAVFILPRSIHYEAGRQVQSRGGRFI